MAEEAVLRLRDGTEGTCQAEVTRYSSAGAAMRAAPIAIGGIVLGAASIVIPGVHLISTWLLPLIGVGVAFFVFRVRTVVGRVDATCPSCSKPFSVEKAGTIDDDALWIRCPHCNSPLACIPAAASSEGV